ncbi:hypothetical protein PRIPAC_95777 [Pristionchus pacificus]|uniref:G_PROTEIN_RECEP_F1_2 domain-containing protein n=1 Tax=Pristionchus pacificus TaxID=54126 RepID=A0A2A6CUQ7_PRIPA|nr:hypothetical protein PRIPAC_95777 [Pristionchus pacificus]|eukprot:PDM81751.1 hypothetical protein PRIPAC_30732 [Pristionchus pacificus]
MSSSEMNSTMEPPTNSTEEQEIIYCDEDPVLRLYFVTVGTTIATFGCACNLLLLFVFLTKNRHQWSTYLIFLAILDFLLCFLYVTSFGLESAAKYFRIHFLYDLIRLTTTYQFTLSKVVQVCIPYVLIAISAERLAWIGKIIRMRNRGSHRGSLLVCVCIAVLWTALRAPGFHAIDIYVYENGECDYFESMPIVSTNLTANPQYIQYDLLINFFHLFVSFCVLFILNLLIVHRLRLSHQNARRNSSCPNVVLSATKQMVLNEEKKEHKRLRCAIKTTAVVISTYLACNSIHFALYMMEMFSSHILKSEDGGFNMFYVITSDVGTILFVLCSTIRLFIYYKYNPDVKSALKTIPFLPCFAGQVNRPKTSAYECTMPLQTDKESPSSV